MKIAIIGAGISGLTAAYMLNQKHDIFVYEADSRLGGHTATKRIQHKGKDYDIDTGFIVFNDWTYPNFQRLLQQLGVPAQKTSMGFSVCCENTGLEYSGGNLNTLFAQRRNLLNINHWRMLNDILRFNKEALSDVNSGGDYLQMTLGQYLDHKRYSAAFIDKYLVPMGAAIWSASTKGMHNFSLVFFVRFFKNHGLLSVKKRPQWYVIKGGSNTYISSLVADFKQNIRLNSSVKSIVRSSANVAIETTSGDVEHFDQVIIACHSDQALSMLSDANQAEKNILGAIPYQSNDVVLHTDSRLLPNRKRTWSSWNYRICGDAEEQMNNPPILTYNMNILQSIESEDVFCVTLNKKELIDPQKILGVYQYSHPIFSLEAIKAQSQWHRINGINRTWFCGAYWGNGFHEDGVVSALKVTEAIGCGLRLDRVEDSQMNIIEGIV